MRDVPEAAEPGSKHAAEASPPPPVSPLPELRSLPDGPAPHAGQGAPHTLATPRMPPPARRWARRLEPALSDATVEKNNSPDAGAAQTHPHRALPGQRREGLPPPRHAPPSSSGRQSSPGGVASSVGGAGERGQARGRGSPDCALAPTRAPRSSSPQSVTLRFPWLKGTGTSLQAQDIPRGML